MEWLSQGLQGAIDETKTRKALEATAEPLRKALGRFLGKNGKMYYQNLPKGGRFRYNCGPGSIKDIIWRFDSRGIEISHTSKKQVVSLSRLDPEKISVAKPPEKLRMDR